MKDFIKEMCEVAKERTKKSFELWKTGVKYLLYDVYSSFFVYFSVIFTEIILLWHFGKSYALPFSILLGICVLNVFICSVFKGLYEGEKKEVFFSRIYIFVFGVVFLIGFFINKYANFKLFFTPFLITGLWILLKNVNLTLFFSKKYKVLMVIFKLFELLTCVIALFFPCILVTWAIFLTDIPLFTKYYTSILYALMMPMVAVLEDIGSCNIFEVAYEIAWDEEHERFKQLLEKDPKAAKEEIYNDLKRLAEQVEDLKK